MDISFSLNNNNLSLLVSIPTQQQKKIKRYQKKCYYLVHSRQNLGKSIIVYNTLLYVYFYSMTMQRRGKETKRNVITLYTQNKIWGRV